MTSSLKNLEAAFPVSCKPGLMSVNFVTASQHSGSAAVSKLRISDLFLALNGPGNTDLHTVWVSDIQADHVDCPGTDALVPRACADRLLLHRGKNPCLVLLAGKELQKSRIENYTAVFEQRQSPV